MRENALELVSQILLIFLYGVGATVAVIIGVMIEMQSYGYVLAGEYRMAAWVGAIGLVALVTAYLLITDNVRSHVEKAIAILTDDSP